MKLLIKVVPKSSRDRVSGWMGDTLKVCVTAAPERGKANAAVVNVLSDILDLPRASVRIVSGETSSRKTVEIDGLEADEMRRRLRTDTPS